MPDLFSTSLKQMEEEVRLLHEYKGFSYWVPQIWRYDALTLIPKLAEIAPGVEFVSSASLEI